MNRHPLEQMRDSHEASRGVFKRHPPDNPVNLVAQREKVFSQIAAILTGDACNKSFSQLGDYSWCDFAAEASDYSY